MKKTLVLILAGLIALSAAACNNNDDNNSKSENNSSAISSVESKEESKTEDSSTEESKEESKEESSEAVVEKVSDPYEVLTKAWNNYADDEKFSVVGGDMTEEHLTDGAPGKYNLDDADTVEYALSLPSAQFNNVDSAASLMHMLNANTFTCAAFHVKEGVDVEAFSKELRDYIQAKRWMCGMPDKVAVYVVGECVVSCYGHSDLMETFKNHLTEAYPDVSVAYYEDINF